MKRTHKLIWPVLVITILLVNACSKKLDLLPNNAFVDNTAYTTPDRCLLALNGVYDAAQSGVYDPLNGAATSVRGYPFGAANIEQQEMRGEDMVNIATFYQVTYLSTYNTTSPNNVNMWKELYALINKANLAIAGFRTASGGVLTATVAAQYEAECRFLRAMAHHELLLHFARPYSDGNGNQLGVPYHDYPVNTTASLDILAIQKRDTVRNCYAKILADLDFAEANLPAQIVAPAGTTVSTVNNTIRATKAAAIALKMRIKLHMNDWQGVLTEGNKLIPASITPLNFTGIVSPIGGWKLTATVDGPFTNNISTESIFSIKNDALDNAGVNAALSRMYSPNAGGGRGLCAISPIAWNLPSWTCADRRKTVLTVTGQDANNQSNKFTKKYTDITNMSDYAPQIRFAEVLLTQAEAEARNSNAVTGRAVDLLNAVRNRAIIDSVTNQYTTSSFTTVNDLIKAILDERRIEFLAEGKRWGDIHRLSMDPNFSTGGIPAKMANGFSNIAVFPSCSGAVPASTVSAIPYSDYRFLWPIPQQERITNPIIEQNPGY